MVVVLAVQIGCPGHEWTDALAVVGFVALVLVAGVLAAVAWEHAGAVYRRRLPESD